jgi:hypothetical protein
MTETTTTLMLQLVADPRPRGTAAYEAQLEVAEQFQGALQALGKLREIEASGSRF